MYKKNKDMLISMFEFLMIHLLRSILFVDTSYGKIVYNLNIPSFWCLCLYSVVAKGTSFKDAGHSSFRSLTDP